MTPDSSAGRWPTLTSMLTERAGLHPDRVAVRFLADDGSSDSLTYGELFTRVTRLAMFLRSQAASGDRAAMLFPPGIEFVVGFFGCSFAGLIAVPTCYPRPQRAMPRFDAVINSCRPKVLLGDRRTLDALDVRQVPGVVAGLRVVATDDMAATANDCQPTVAVAADDPAAVALLQYTSGSTSEAKGVSVLHRNLMANLEAIRRGFGLDWQPTEAADSELETGVFWLPAYHDMGLIGGILAPLYIGGSTVLMSPRSFLAHPLRWLEMISRYRATISGAPNFAYQLCADRCTDTVASGLDLSRWKLAFCGAEPVSATTLDRFAETFSGTGFRRSAFYPCYGLAEATLLAAGPSGPGDLTFATVDRKSLASGRFEPLFDGDAKLTTTLVSSGVAATDTRIIIVDPETRQPLDDAFVGEIWISGRGVAAGYFERPEESESTFAATLDNGDGPWLRTGDLGVRYDEELFVTGRLKDVIIVRGRNLYPQDIEQSVATTLGPAAGKVAVFSVPGPYGEELAVVAEVARSLETQRLAEVTRQVRLAIVGEHEIDVRHVRLVRWASIPVTTSGKVQRSLCRDRMLADGLKCRHRWDRTALRIAGALPPTPVIDPTDRVDSIATATVVIEDWLLQWLIQRIDVPAEQAIADRPFADFGLDSLATLELVGELRDWLGLDLDLVLAWNYPTVAKLAAYLAEQLAGPAGHDTETATDSGDRATDLESLLDDIERLTDDEIDNAIAAEREF